MRAGHRSGDDLRRSIAADADVSTIGPTLIGAVHLLYADADGASFEAAAPGWVGNTCSTNALRGPDVSDSAE